MLTTTAAEMGWYLYGITRREPLADSLASLQLFEFAGLAAVVRPVLLADFRAAALQERLQDASALEAAVRSHNDVIEAIHARQAILPAKFGMVYTRADDLVSSLQSAHDVLLDQVERLEGCDEWAVHVYADPAIVRERVATQDPAIQLLREQCAASRPGRAYFLEQQLREELTATTAETLSSLAQNVFDRLARFAVARAMNPVAATAAADGGVEILRASFLVARDRAEQFQHEVRASADTAEGLRSEYTGPWPPYSFAATNDTDAP